MESYAQDLRRNATPAEKHLWQRLRRRQISGFKFRRERAIGRYICDFVCLEASLIIELDGSQHIIDAPYDAARDAFLRANGFRVLRFWNGHVLNETASVVETIYEALHRPDMDGRFD